MRSALTLLLAAILSGCAAAPEVEVTLPIDPTLGATGAPGAAPNGLGNEPSAWRVGDWWRYSSDASMPGVPDTTITAVVAEDGPAAWTLTAAEGLAANVTFFTHVPALGPVRKADWAVTRHGQFVPYLSFPLEEGKTWTVEVRGPWTATAKAAQAKVGGQTLDAWRIEYRSGETLQHVIEWAAGANWITYEASYNGAEDPRIEVRLLEFGVGRTGPITVFEATDVHVKGHFFDPARPEASTGREDFTVPSSGSALLIGIFTGGGASAAVCAHAFTSPAGSNENRAGGNACGPHSLEWTVRPVTPGTWSSSWIVQGEGSYVFVEVLLLTTRPVELKAL